MAERTFIIDCPRCKAKVAAIERGRAERSGLYAEVDEPFGYRLLVGNCPSCDILLAGESRQTDFEGHDGAEYDRWSDAVRVYPKPPKTFISYRIPAIVKDSLLEAERSLQAGANIAGCMMLGRTLEAICRDVLTRDDMASGKAKSASGKKLMLSEGVKQLKDKGVIDQRLYDWSQDLRAFRNLAAHAEDVTISREDADDLQVFVYALIEYIYDLTDRYNEFKQRVESRKKKKEASS